MKEFELVRKHQYYDEHFKVEADPKSGEAIVSLQDGDENSFAFGLDSLEVIRLRRFLNSFDRRPGDID